MSYREDQRRRATLIRDAIFRDPGAGVFYNKEREFVLQDSTLNLWAGIRADAMAYFNRNSITWWKGDENSDPTGHLLSSQVACVNHLYFVRQRQDVATAILRSVREDVEAAVTVDDGFVEFEVVGAKNYLGEKSHTRGANATSVDAVMLGRKASGATILFLIEWKYTEDYREDCMYIDARKKIYDPLLTQPDSPIVFDDRRGLYYEPFYQLMRQALLGWKMVEGGEYGCDEWMHLHIIPQDNVELRERVTSPVLRTRGGSMSEAWKSVLREPDRYRVISPETFIAPARGCPDTESIVTYLDTRYWS